tara:strand:- start:1411 stop:1989 length:579 start_codon:yes stop_codon:yes gene_type:complete
MLKSIIFIFLNIIYAHSIFNNFIHHHSIFLNNSIKNITFDYNSQNIDGLEAVGSGTIIVDSNNYKVILDNHIFLFKNSIFKRYNKKTNQIFIESSDPFIDSLVVNFFDSNFLQTIQLDSLGWILNNSILSENQQLAINLQFSVDSSFIESINFTYDSFSINLFNIIFSNLDSENSNLFKINAPGAFILDLRD